MVECVDTISELRTISKKSNIPASDFPCVLVRGYADSGDGGGGYFVWDKNLTNDDSGTMIKPTDPIIKPGENADKGGWKRVFEDLLNVKWFGSKGDMKEYYQIYDPAIKGQSTRRYQGNIIANDNVLKLSLPLEVTGFMPDDINKTIVIWDGSKRFVNKIKTFINLGTVELTGTAKESFSNAFVSWGTDDSIPIQKALDAAKEFGYAVYLPPGHFLITRSLLYSTSKINHDPTRYGTSSFELMRHGLRFFGAGMQKSFLHNLIEAQVIEDTYPSSRAAIVIDGTGGTLLGSWQQTGFLKDFHIVSTGHISSTVGIDLLATFGYTIQNVTIMNMGSHGIIVRNRYVEPIYKSSDFDQTDKLYLDNLFVFKNDGWGIFVDAVEGAISTSKIHINRCKIEENKGGGIQWTGQGGIIEQCGIYGNGVIAGTTLPTFQAPKAIAKAYGILVKNVTAISNGLMITGCEIQGNADVQVMIEEGANIKLIQNDFKDESLSIRFTFPSVDIQVGDGNKNARYVYGCHIEDNRIRMSWTEWGKYKLGSDEAKKSTPKHTVVKVNTNALSTVISGWWTAQFWGEEDEIHKLIELVENVEIDPTTGKPYSYANKLGKGLIPSNTHIQRTGVDGRNEGGHVLLPFASKVINLDENLVKKPVEVNTLRWGKFRFRVPPNITSFTLQNPTGYSTGALLFLGFVSASPSDVTVIFSDGYDIAGKKIIVPKGKTVTGILLFDESGKWLPFSPWTCEGKPLPL